MGLYQSISEKLPSQFSVFQLMKCLQMNESDLNEARNILRLWHQNGFINRISKNMYLKLK
jgi:hypothetical protein